MKKLQRKRNESGWYQYVCKPDRMPTQKELDKAKSDAKANIEKKDLLGICACCKRQMATGSDVSYIIKTGLCGWCTLYKEGKALVIICLEPPTLEEVLDRAKNGLPLAPTETRMLFKEYSKLKAK